MVLGLFSVGILFLFYLRIDFFQGPGICTGCFDCCSKDKEDDNDSSNQVIAFYHIIKHVPSYVFKDVDFIIQNAHFMFFWGDWSRT